MGKRFREIEHVVDGNENITLTIIKGENTRNSPIWERYVFLLDNMYNMFYIINKMSFLWYNKQFENLAK